MVAWGLPEWSTSSILSRDKHIKARKLNIFPSPIAYILVSRYIAEELGKDLTLVMMPPGVGVEWQILLSKLLIRYIDCCSPWNSPGISHIAHIQPSQGTMLGLPRIPPFYGTLRVWDLELMNFWSVLHDKGAIEITPGLSGWYMVNSCHGKYSNSADWYHRTLKLLEGNLNPIDQTDHQYVLARALVQYTS